MVIRYLNILKTNSGIRNNDDLEFYELCVIVSTDYKNILIRLQVNNIITNFRFVTNRHMQTVGWTTARHRTRTVLTHVGTLCALRQSHKLGGNRILKMHQENNILFASFLTSPARGHLLRCRQAFVRNKRHSTRYESETASDGRGSDRCLDSR